MTRSTLKPNLGTGDRPPDGRVGWGGISVTSVIEAEEWKLQFPQEQG